MESADVESTIRQLCTWACAQRDPRQLKFALMQLREFVHEHREVLRSMSDDTFEALRKTLWH